MKHAKALLLLLMLTFISGTCLKAQMKLETRTAKVTFRSQTPIEEFYSENNQVASILKLDGNKKVLAFNVIMRSFKFDKALMEEHFNEKYVHSEKYPTAKFIGELATDVDLTNPGMYKNINLSGTMVLHGVSRQVTIPVDLEVSKNNEIKGHATFRIKPEDFNIEIPKLVSEKISREIMVTVDALYKLAK